MGEFLGFIGFIGFLAVVYVFVVVCPCLFVIKRSKNKARGDGGKFTKPTHPSDEK